MALLFLSKRRKKEMIKITTSESKTTPAKKNIQLKNISVRDLKIVDTDTGEDIAEQVVAEIPAGVDVVNFKLTFDLPDKEESDDM